MKFDAGQVAFWSFFCFLLVLACLIWLGFWIAEDVVEFWLNLVRARDEIHAERQRLQLEILEREQQALRLESGKDGYRQTQLVLPGRPIPMVAAQAALGWEPRENVPHSYHYSVKNDVAAVQPRISVSDPGSATALPENVDLLSMLGKYSDRLGQMSDSPLLYLGESVNGPVIVPLSECYHLGWQGPTQSGKSAAMRSIVVQLRRKFGATTEIVLIDPLRKEARKYEGLDNTIIADDNEKAIAALESIHATVLNRLRKSPEELAALPYILVMIDELFFCTELLDADLTTKLNQCYSLSASAKIYFLAGTQKMDAKGKGMIKANTRSKFAFSGSDRYAVTAWGMDSRQLPTERRKGLALYNFADVSTIEDQEGIVQFAYISPEDMRRDMQSWGHEDQSPTTEMVLDVVPRGPRLSQEDETLLLLYREGHTSCRSLAQAATLAGHKMAKDKAAARMAALGLKEVKEVKK